MRGRLWPHVALVVVGVVAVAWALTLGAHPVITCRDAVMGPGDVCANAQGTRQQTYEERRDAALAARPVVGGVGVLLAGFGGALAAGHLKGAGSSSRAPRSRRPAA